MLEPIRMVQIRKEHTSTAFCDVVALQLSTANGGHNTNHEQNEQAD
jgi:hypothetical protein